MDKQNLKDITSFNDVIEGMLKSKFVLVDKSIGKVLTEIAKNKTVYNIIAECTISYNFNREYELACSGSKFSVPLEDDKCIAFVFLLLTNIDSKKIDITKFISENFHSENQYNEFLEKVIIPFKIAILHYYDENLVDNDKQEVLAPTLTTEIASRISFLFSNFLSKLNADKKLKKDILNNSSIIIKTIINEIDNGKTSAVYALYIGLKCVLKARRYKKYFSEIDELSNYFIGE